MSKLERLHNIIKQDLLQNKEELFYRYNYYTKKYRSNELNFEVNVGLFLDEDDTTKQVAQIYLADNKIRLRERLIFREDKLLLTELIVRGKNGKRN